ncbi:HypC/HybG/HupF family hydrogenase formation chaperone [Alisedimentitalea sp. MJ-SS2]|uniref:HypC/HybG/HupF family hydrogenase formation chaperone n=1 Tax=Aliisedimentitalea sp. MJ-SS2 TaxID=3049795 RepID=UPI00290F2A15|nr:HypC/HybG/HupF family hydrogenase formation chaperone [Alisedimentitalea sp. MJ-SS2]MDU8925776.1 HypC/HybG/HupF family hydrogenase formation chaperone [Alisedimentitalea sp. MJ-SS2]
MCLAVPARIVKMYEGGMADVELEGVIKDVSVELVDDVTVGDYVIVHVGYALAKLDPEEAERTLALFAQAGATA